jgi:hypothetical protein
MNKLKWLLLVQFRGSVMNKLKWLLPLALFVPLLMAPSGGYPSRPIFSTVGIGGAPQSAANSNLSVLSNLSTNAAVVYMNDTTTGSGFLCMSDTAGACTTGQGAHDLLLYGGNGGALDVQGFTTLNLQTNGTTRESIASGGAVTISAPTSGIGITATGISTQFAAEFISAASGTEDGVYIQAGALSTDTAFYITNKANTVLFLDIFGDGGVNVGAPTGGDLGAGTVNLASNLSVNNVVITKSAYGAWTGSTCTAIASFAARQMTCSRGGAGNYTMTLSAGFSNFPICTVTQQGTGLGTGVQPIQLNTISATSVQVTAQVTGVATDENFYIYCTGT